MNILTKNLNILLGLIIFIALIPLFLVLSILILLIDRMHPIFKQDRIGLNRKIISIYKFRTLTVSESKGIIEPVSENDYRITKLGYFLRITNIDELLQIINIIRGEINFIGPRPLAMSQDRDYESKISKWNERYLVKPGITGISQSLGYSGGDDIKRYKIICKLDRYFIRNDSITLKYKIIIKTIKTLLKI